MKAIQVHSDESLAFEEVADPVLASDCVQIAVKAAGINRADLAQAKGKYPPPSGSSEILGLEAAGVIEAVGANVQEWEAGDAVMALLPGGGYASKAVIPQRMLLPMPNSWSYTEAAAVPEALYTAYLHLCYQGQLGTSETVVIHAGAGGIGSTAIQLARAYGNTVIATTGSADKVSFCQRLGTDHVLNYREDDLEKRLLSIAPEGIDIVLDPIGNTAYADLHTNVLKRYGRWLLLGVLGGGQPVELNMARILGQNLMLKGSTLRYQSPAFKAYLTQQLEDEVLLLYQQGEMVPCVDRTFPVSEAEQAHEYLRSNQVQGKVILTF